MQALPPGAPPPYSCRSGLSVPFVVGGPQGKDFAYMRMTMRRRAMLDDVYHGAQPGPPSWGVQV
jgi:hypothetical protein